MSSSRSESHSISSEKKHHSSDHKKRLHKDDEDQKSTESKKVKTEPMQKISFGMSAKSSKPSISKSALNSFKMDLQKKAAGTNAVGFKSKSNSTKPVKSKFAAAFGGDDSEEEEMPPEAKMRMKNIGRDTPTSAGPNSFGKSRMGFCDSKKMYEKQLREIEEKLCEEKE